MIRKLAAFFLMGAVLFVAGCSDDECPTCAEKPVLTLNKHKVNFGATGTTASFTIDNTGGGSMPWDLTIGYRFLSMSASAAHGGWLELSTASGEGDATITLTADRDALDEIGISRAVVIINAPDADNVIRDSVDIYILNGGAWLISDDSTFEQCWEVDSLDYYWIKGFHMPHGQDRVFVDSIALNFCQADTFIQLLAYDGIYSDLAGTDVPNNLVYADAAMYEVQAGWNVLPLYNLYAYTDPFYVGYFQPGSTRPDLRIDVVDDMDTLCWRARDVSTEPGEVLLEWQWSPGFETFAIRVFVTPVLDYNPKMAAEYAQTQAEATLRTGFAYKGKYPMSVRPQLPR